MKIVNIITRSDAVGGAHVHVLDLSSAFLKKGWEILVLTGGEGPFTLELKQRGIPYFSLPHLGRPINLKNDWLALKEIRGTLKEFNPDLVTTHSSKAGWLGRMAARSLSIPVIFTAHGWAFTDGVSPRAAFIYRLAERLAAPLTDKIITVSDYDRELAFKYLIAPSDKIKTIHNGVPDISGVFKADPSLKKTPKLIMVARFEEQKDHRTLLNALTQLKDEVWTLELIGDGPLRLPVEKMARELSIFERIKFEGVSRNISEKLAKAHIFLLISNWEGFPLTILEAMRAGLPVIASDVGGARESVLEGETGYLIPRGDVDTLVKRIRRLLKSPELRIQFGKAGLLRYKSKFTFEKFLVKTEETYLEVLEKSKRNKKRIF